MLRRSVDACAQARIALQRLHFRTPTHPQGPLMRPFSAAASEAVTMPWRRRPNRTRQDASSEKYKTPNRRPSRGPKRSTWRTIDGLKFPLGQLGTWENLPSFGRLRDHTRLRHGLSPRRNEYLIQLPAIQDGVVKLTPWSFTFKSNIKLENALMSMYKRREQAMLNWFYVQNHCPSDSLDQVGELFWFWKFEFNKLSAGLEPTYEKEDLAKRLYKLDNVADMKETWNAISQEEQQQWWPHVMLCTLSKSLQKADMVLEATRGSEQGYIAADSLDFIVQRLHLDGVEAGVQRQQKADRILSLASEMFEDIDKSGCKIRQGLLGLLAKRLPADHAATLYGLLAHTGKPLHSNSLLQFASKLGGDAAHKQTAFEILRGMVEKDSEFFDNDRHEVCSSVITTLLLCPPQEEGGDTAAHAEFDPKAALEYFMEAGFRPNIVSLSAYLTSLALNGKGEEALRLASLFAEEGVLLDLKGWQIVMRGAKLSKRLDLIAQGIKVGKDIEIPAMNVLSNTLHTVFHIASKETRSKEMTQPWSLPLFRQMLRLYAMRFDLADLQWWIPEPLPLLLVDGTDTKFDRLSESTHQTWNFLSTVVPLAENVFALDFNADKMVPTDAIIAVMLRAYIKSLRQPYDIMSFYAFFKSKVEAREAKSVDLMKSQGTLLHDTLITSMTEHHGLLKAALQVFGDMLRSSVFTPVTPSPGEPQDLDEHEAAAGLPTHPAPSALTYNVVLRGLASQSEDKLAAQVLQVMKENQIKMTSATMNTMIKTYAKSQNAAGTVQALQDLEAAGFKPNHYTYSAFSQLRNQVKALELMDMIIENNREKEGAAAQQSL